MKKCYVTKSYNGKSPVIPQSCTIFENCVLMGDIRLGENCVIMPGCVLRAEHNPIIIGDNTNVQDLTCIHSEVGENGSVIIGKNVTIGHRAIIHGCKINDNTLIGMNATILSYSVVEENCFIGACSLVTENAIIPKGSVAFGIPAKVKRQVNENDMDYISETVKDYKLLAKEYNKEV